jgi:hypothetical protein
MVLASGGMKGNANAHVAMFFRSAALEGAAFVVVIGREVSLKSY